MPQTIAAITFTHTLTAEQERVLTPEAVGFVAGLQRRFNLRRRDLLHARATVRT